MTPSTLLSRVTSSSVTNFTRTDIYEYLFSLGKINSLGYVGNMTCGIFLCIIGILGCFGNGLVIIIFFKSSALLKKPYNMLLLNMAIADILVMGTAYPFSTLSAFYGRYIFSATVCVYQGYATFLSALTAMYTLVFLSVFRYVAVCIPQLKHRLSSSLTKRCLGFIWAYSIFWTTQPLFGWNRYTLERFGTSCSLDWSSKEATDRLYVMFLIVFCYLLPVSVMCFCYFRILLRALLMQHMRTRLLNIEEPKRLHRASLEVRISGMCFIMAFFYTVVWSPYAVVSVLTMYDVVPLWAYTLPTMFAKMASMLNPFIYVLTSSQFRANLQNTILSFRNSRVLPIKEVSGMSHRHAGVYLVDRTKEGVFIGSQKVIINFDENVYF